MKTNSMPPLDYLRKWFLLDPLSESGLIWRTPSVVYFKNFGFRKRWMKMYDGKIAGAIQKRKNGSMYWIVALDKKMYQVHRIVYFMSTGINPENFVIDHKDYDGLNNKIENLRLCSMRQNNFHRRISSLNTSGFKGVHFAKKMNKWQASIRINGMKKLIGFFNTPEEASEEYMKASMDVHREYSIFN